MNWRRKSSSETLNGFLDSGTSLTGELTFEGTFRIDGEFHGSITTKDILIIGPGAAVHADVKAAEVMIHGVVFGNIDSTRRVSISSTGKLRGDVTTAQLVLEDGALFEGQSRRVSDQEPVAEKTMMTPPQPVVEKAPALTEKSPAPVEKVVPNLMVEKPEGPEKPRVLEGPATVIPAREVLPERPSQPFRSSTHLDKKRWEGLLP